MKTNHALWTLRIVVVAIVAMGSSIIAFSQTPRPAVPAPVMTEELMARLIKFTGEDPDTSSITAETCKIFDLCDGTKEMPVKFAEHRSTDGIHYFGVSQADSKDILIMMVHGTTVEGYLTDKTGKLRAAAVIENGTPHLITNEKATEKFKAELALFAKEAADLPPAGTAAPDHN